MSFPFGPRTQAALVEAIADGFSHSDMTTLFMRSGVDRWDPGAGQVNKATRAQRVIQGLRANGDESIHRASVDLAVEVLKHGDTPDSPFRPRPAWWQPLVDALGSDGFDWDGEAQRLFPAIEGLSVVDEYGALERRLRELGWGTAAMHYRQSLDALAAGQWESANAQVRSFLEPLLPEAASKLLDRTARTDPLAALQDLQRARQLFDGEYDFARGLWKLANPRGSHAGLSDRDEARFRLFVATAYATFLLSRLAE